MTVRYELSTELAGVTVVTELGTNAIVLGIHRPAINSGADAYLNATEARDLAEALIRHADELDQ